VANVSIGSIPDSCTAANRRSLDYLVGALLEEQGYVNPKRLCGFKVDY
jgi:hypothetical protein